MIAGMIFVSNKSQFDSCCDYKLNFLIDSLQNVHKKCLEWIIRMSFVLGHCTNALGVAK